jgi:hypothetical protein
MAAISVYFSGYTTEGVYNVGHTNGRLDNAVIRRASMHWIPKFAKVIGRPEKDLRLRYCWEMSRDICLAWFWFEDECKTLWVLQR